MEERTNQERAARAAAAIKAYAETYDDMETAVTDLLADLRHWCDSKNLDFYELDDIAYGHYREEAIAAVETKRKA